MYRPTIVVTTVIRISENVSEVAQMAVRPGNRGGATVLKVGGTNSASEASRKYFLTPHFLAIWGQNIA